MYDLVKTDILIHMKYFAHILILLSALSFTTSLKAQESTKQAQETLETAKKLADPDSTIIEKPDEDNYVSSSVENLSKLYWKLGALSTKNKEAVDNFLLINECDIYKAFYHDDFQWSDIRSSAAKMIDREKDGFPNQFRFMIPIDLGRYDMRRGGFPLVSDTGVKNLRRIEIGGNDTSSKVCDKVGEIPFYPKNIRMVLNKPLTFDFLPLDEHIAQAFIVRQKYNKQQLSKKDRKIGYGRLAFLQARVTISHFQGLEDVGGATDEQVAVVYGQIDAIDVYEDRERTSLLKTITFKNRSRAKEFENQKSTKNVEKE